MRGTQIRLRRTLFLKFHDYILITIKTYFFFFSKKSILKWKIWLYWLFIFSRFIQFFKTILNSRTYFLISRLFTLASTTFFWNKWYCFYSKNIFYSKTDSVHHCSMSDKFSVLKDCSWLEITVITGMVIRYIRRSNNTKHRGDTNNHFPFYLTWRKTYVLANFFRKSWLRWWKKSFSLSKVKKESTGSKWGSKYCTKGNILLFLLNPKKLNLKGFTFLSFSLFYRKQLLSCHKVLKDTLKAFDKFKNKQKKCMKSCFLICKSIHILRVYSIHYTLR